jgi:hypothetical protein
MVAHTWEELEFRLDVLHATQGAHIEVHWVFEKKLYVCIHQIKLVSHFSWQFIIFNWIVKSVKDFWPTLYITLHFDFKIQSRPTCHGDWW